jgi:RimJ/RimL family protein N-acetyltransferase
VTTTSKRGALTTAVRSVTTDGLELTMRPISPDDGEALVAFHTTLSDESVHHRFFSCHPRLTPAEVYRFTHVDGNDRVALVVLDEERIVAVGRYDRRAGTGEAEVAFVVTDSYQHQGLATLLLRTLADIARANGIDTFVAETLADNYRMRRVFTDAGYEVRAAFDGGVVAVSFPIV